MDNRGYGSSGYSSWGGGGSSNSRGSGGYDMYGYKDSMSSSGGYGGGSGQMKRSGIVSTGTSADAVIAKINQRLDMLTQLEGSGGMKGGGRSERFDQYESYDSRPSSVNPRDLYRSGSYGYGDGPSDLRGGGYGGGAYDAPSSFGLPKARQPRDTFAGPGWGGHRSPRRGGGPGGRGFGRRQEPPMGGGGARGGYSPRGRGRLPSLLSHRMYPESGAYQQPPPGAQDPSGRPFGAGPGMRAGRQRGRKRPVNRINPPREMQKKRKQTVTPGDEPESKMGKTEADNTESTNDSAQPSGEAAEAKSSAAEKVTADSDALTMQEEINQIKKKLQGKAATTPDKVPKQRKRRSFQERAGAKPVSQRVMFACSVCKFRSFYSEDMVTHMESRFHKDHFRFLTNQLSKPTIDFLQEYLNNKFKKTEERTKQIDNLSATICQVYKEQDLTRDIGMEHFMKKVEAAHCAACDLFIPMQHHLIQRHLKSPDHNFNRKGMMEQSKHSSLSVARSILNHKVIAKKLESYLKGENPFDDKDAEDSLMDVSGAELEDKSQAAAADGNHAPAGEGPGNGAEVKMEEEELEGVLGEDCLEGEEEEESHGGEVGPNAEGEELKEGGEEPEGEADEAEPKEEEAALLNEDEEGVEGVLGQDEEGVEGDLGEDDEGVEAEEEEGVEVVDEEEGIPGELDEGAEQDQDDDDGVVLVE